jgi:hypothetical protein
MVAPPGAIGSPASVFRLDATGGGHVGEGCTAGTPKLVLVKVIEALLNGPVSIPLSGMRTGPTVHDTPKSPVDPPTSAFMLTGSPFCDDVQGNVPEITLGLATKGTDGVKPGISVISAESEPNI